MKRILPVLSLALSLSACATLQQQRCSALQDELAEANAPCGDCLKRLSPSGDAQLCQYVCAHGATVSPVAVSACSAAATVQSPAAVAEPSAADAEATVSAETSE